MELGHLTGEDATKFVAEGKGASDTTNDDFPPDVVAYMDRGIKYALSSPAPAPEEGGMWVYKESQ